METCPPAAATATTCHVVAMPYPGRGHINPMMNLCKLISLKKPDILFSFIITEEWFNLISSDKIPPNIILRTIPNVIPSELVRAKNFQAFIESVGKDMESPFEVVLDRIFSEGFGVNVIIADSYLDWVVRVGNRRNIPVASLWTMSASVFSIFHHFDLLRRNGHFPIQLSERGEEQVDYIPGIPPTRFADFPTIFHEKYRNILLIALDYLSIVPKAQYLLFTSTYELEPQVIDALKLKFPFPLLNLGPTIPYFELRNPNFEDQNVPDYIKWLNSQPRSSVLYVSMGSFLSVSSTQMEEFIAGIFDSGVPCLCVSRGENVVFENDDGDDHKRLVVPWCDQLRVLNHPSVGGFWTHCGWNSTLEAVYSGIPILASPIFWDQVPNSKKVVEDWKIGWKVRRGVEGEILVKRHEIKKLVEDFMNSESTEVIEIRRRAKKLKEVCQVAIAKGGSSDTNLDFFIKDISVFKKNVA
ncbi:UDP-glycosyltransferase 87A1-like [Euphorbia lathyris]|uniref:UDP-glycosyltransferase 87A1-like n=1 Tax=Euphorbia lathyris TaxID=212925 RepID=UPI003313AF39